MVLIVSVWPAAITYCHAQAGQGQIMEAAAADVGLDTLSLSAPITRVLSAPVRSQLICILTLCVPGGYRKPRYRHDDEWANVHEDTVLSGTSNARICRMWSAG